MPRIPRPLAFFRATTPHRELKGDSPQTDLIAPSLKTNSSQSHSPRKPPQANEPRVKPSKAKSRLRKLGYAFVTGWAVTCTPVGSWLVNSIANLIGVISRTCAKTSNGNLSFEEFRLESSFANITGQDLEGITTVEDSTTAEDSTAIEGISLIYKYGNLIKFEGDEDKTIDGKICRAFIPKGPRGKPLYVLILGHEEELNWSSQSSGMVHFYERLTKEEKGIILLFRTGLATEEISHMISFTYKPKYEPNIVFDQTKSILHDFIRSYKPTELRIAGYSWGGGTIAKLSKYDDWRQGVPVARTVMIDPIYSGALNFGAPLRKRVEFTNSPRHLNFHVFQRNDSLSNLQCLFTLQGNSPICPIENGNGKPNLDIRYGDVILRVFNSSHLDIDDITEVRTKGYEFLTSPSAIGTKLALGNLPNLPSDPKEVDVPIFITSGSKK